MNPNLRTALLSRFIILKTGLCDKFDSKEQFLSAERYKTTKKISLSFFLRQAIFHFFFSHFFSCSDHFFGNNDSKEMRMR